MPIETVRIVSPHHRKRKSMASSDSSGGRARSSSTAARFRIRHSIVRTKTDWQAAKVRMEYATTLAMMCRSNGVETNRGVAVGLDTRALATRQADNARIDIRKTNRYRECTGCFIEASIIEVVIAREISAATLKNDRSIPELVPRMP